MEIKDGKVRINRKEMQAIKKMDHQQIEDKLTEAYQKGKAEMNGWQQAVEQTLEETKGIGQGRKELFMERLNLKLAAGQKAAPIQ